MARLLTKFVEPAGLSVGPVGLLVGPDGPTKAVFECLRTPHAQDFLLAIPIDRLGQHMSPVEYRTILNSLGFKYRHDMVRDVLFYICRSVGISAKKEAPVNFLTDQIKDPHSDYRLTSAVHMVALASKLEERPIWLVDIFKDLRRVKHCLWDMTIWGMNFGSSNSQCDEGGHESSLSRHQKKRECQVKKESVKTRHPQLHYESKIYRLLQAKKGDTDNKVGAENWTSDEFNNKIVSKWNGRKMLQGNTTGTIKGGIDVLNKN
ncbi:hypothetical protein Tco_0014258 [Tanacetum coccineum]